VKRGAGEWGPAPRDDLVGKPLKLKMEKNGNLPAGGNEGFADGSVSWNKAETMYNFYSANGATRNFYFYQSDVGTFPMSTANPNKFPN
jgi:hypothetical protein